MRIKSYEPLARFLEVLVDDEDVTSICLEADSVEGWARLGEWGKGGFIVDPATNEEKSTLRHGQVTLTDIRTREEPEEYGRAEARAVYDRNPEEFDLAGGEGHPSPWFERARMRGLGCTSS